MAGWSAGAQPSHQTEILYVSAELKVLQAEGYRTPVWRCALIVINLRQKHVTVPAVFWLKVFFFGGCAHWRRCIWKATRLTAGGRIHWESWEDFQQTKSQREKYRQMGRLKIVYTCEPRERERESGRLGLVQLSGPLRRVHSHHPSGREVLALGKSGLD